MSDAAFRRPTSPLEPFKRLGRTIGLNKAYDTVWRRPLKDLRALARDGGPFERHKTLLGHAAMRERAATLPTMAPPELDRGSQVHILTGEGFWHQSVYCVASLQLVSEERISPVFYSDGKLHDAVKTSIRRVVPWARFVDTSEIESRLDLTLPEKRFPTLRSRRKEYIHLRKLTDIHVFAEPWKLVLDSDLLFYRTPASVLEWFARPQPMCMQDIFDNYGYPMDYLASLAKTSLPKLVNVGLYGLNSETIDWEKVEYWCARQIADFGPSYLQEQGLTAMIFAGQDLHVLPANEYVLLPRLREGRAPLAIMHHYVDHSKRSYFQYGWQEIDRRIRSKVAGKEKSVAAA